MKHLGLFAGFGGFELAASWAGWETVAWCEWNEFCQRLLKYHFPDAVGHSDITQTDFTQYANQIDVLTGGFPCQPYSLAGQRKGTEDERHLWPEMLRAIREIRPPWVVGENVRGIVSWSAGLVFEQVQADLETEGYEVLTFILPAAGVNAPHLRERLWFVAYSESLRRRASFCKKANCNRREGSEHITKWPKIWDWNQTTGRTGILADTSSKRPEEWQQIGRRENEKKNRAGLEYEPERFGSIESTSNTQSQQSERIESSEQREACSQKQGEFGGSDCKSVTVNSTSERRRKVLYDLQPQQPDGQKSNAFDEPIDWSKFPTQSPICGGDDGISAELDGITFSKWRTESIKGYGNAIVPQVALRIFNVINEMMKND